MCLSLLTEEELNKLPLKLVQTFDWLPPVDAYSELYAFDIHDGKVLAKRIGKIGCDRGV